MFDKITDQLLRNPGGGRPDVVREPRPERRMITAKKRALHTPVENPWGVTPAEAAAMDAVIRHGGNREAAAAIGLSVKTVECQRSGGAQKIPGGTPLTKILRWYELRRVALGLDKEFSA